MWEKPLPTKQKKGQCVSGLFFFKFIFLFITIQLVINASLRSATHFSCAIFLTLEGQPQ
ncbi:hypothetical protein BN1182_BQ_00050 [Pantoea ananatis]|nr:hypothetical protein BN1182_BQ_00050 [Pantoea ananatis]CRH34552.1 hypothetical protein BN1183_BK_00070 [Pantoea ananatis]